jgi:hypothetical protein
MKSADNGSGIVDGEGDAPEKQTDPENSSRAQFASIASLRL